MEFKRELDNSIIGDCIISSSAIDKTRPKTKPKQNQNLPNTEDLKNSINHFDLIDIYRLEHPTMTKYFFSRAHEKCAYQDSSSVGLLKISLKFKKTDIRENVFSMVELNYKLR